MQHAGISRQKSEFRQPLLALKKIPAVMAFTAIEQCDNQAYEVCSEFTIVPLLYSITKK
jgi:hypothetical protein